MTNRPAMVVGPLLEGTAVRAGAPELASILEPSAAKRITHTRAGSIHRTTGFVKFIASTIDERVLGVHVIGESAPEIIHEAAMAMKFKATLSDFVDLIHVYPTMSEALKIGAQAFSRDVTKLSCCAE